MPKKIGRISLALIVDISGRTHNFHPFFPCLISIVLRRHISINAHNSRAHIRFKVPRTTRNRSNIAHTRQLKRTKPKTVNIILASQPHRTESNLLQIRRMHAMQREFLLIAIHDVRFFVCSASLDHCNDGKKNEKFPCRHG